MEYPEIALHVPSILLPAPGVDLTKWAVIACDQYTSEPAKWEEIARCAGESPSTLGIIFPEVYLEDGHEEQRITAINENMQRYLAEGALAAQKPGFILVDRQTAHMPSRKGLVVALDLEHYDYRPGSQTLIRATEGTVMERIPPRVKIRENALIESPHIMVLIDDPDKTVIEPLFEKNPPQVYDFELMMHSGHLKGYLVDDAKAIAAVAAALARLASPATIQAKYGVDAPALLYAMGDGNHSLATAKTIWETIKAQATDKTAIMRHPARYSLVELVNIHDAGLAFEPIHRVLFNLQTPDFLSAMQVWFTRQGGGFTSKPAASQADALAMAQKSEGVHRFPYVAQGAYGCIEISNPPAFLEYATLQPFLDAWLKNTPAAKIDYVHGDDVVNTLGSQPGNLGFWMPAIAKQSFFKTIMLDGALPRKTFSMGHADEKRFYLECRKIKD